MQENLDSTQNQDNAVFTQNQDNTGLVKEQEFVETVQTQEYVEVQTDLQPEEKVKLPAKYFFIMIFQRLGDILSNYVITSYVIAFIAFLGIVFFPFVIIANYIVAMLIAVFTLGLIFLERSFESLIIFTPEGISQYTDFIWKAMPIMSWVLFGVSIVALILSCVNFRKPPVARIVINVILVIFSIVAVILTSLFVV